MAARVGSTPSSSASRPPMRLAVAAVVTICAPPLSTMARRNRPLARGIASRVPTLSPPADLAEDRDIAGIAAEGRDVVAHPFERGDLVEQPEIGDAVAKAEEAGRRRDS